MLSFFKKAFCWQIIGISSRWHFFSMAFWLVVIFEKGILSFELSSFFNSNCWHFVSLAFCPKTLEFNSLSYRIETARIESIPPLCCPCPRRNSSPCTAAPWLSPDPSQFPFCLILKKLFRAIRKASPRNYLCPPVLQAPRPFSSAALEWLSDKCDPLAAWWPGGRLSPCTRSRIQIFLKANKADGRHPKWWFDYGFSMLTKIVKC